jgi:hypothetical protein
MKTNFHEIFGMERSVFFLFSWILGAKGKNWNFSEGENHETMLWRAWRRKYVKYTTFVAKTEKQNIQSRRPKILLHFVFVFVKAYF